MEPYPSNPLFLHLRVSERMKCIHLSAPSTKKYLLSIYSVPELGQAWGYTGWPKEGRPVTMKQQK